MKISQQLLVLIFADYFLLKKIDRGQTNDYVVVHFYGIFQPEVVTPANKAWSRPRQIQSFWLVVKTLETEMTPITGSRASRHFLCWQPKEKSVGCSRWKQLFVYANIEELVTSSSINFTDDNLTDRNHYKGTFYRTRIYFLIILIIHWLEMIKSWHVYLFLWNKFWSQHH